MANQPPVLNNVTIIPHGLDPSSPEFQTIVESYKTTRLAALQSDPDAFASTYQRESLFSNEVWTSRLQNPLSKTLIALDQPAAQAQVTPNAAAVSPLLTCRWLGQLVLLGPVLAPDDASGGLQLTPWKLFRDIDYAEAAKTLIPRDAHLAYMLAGMFVLRGARGSGNGMRLVEASLDAVREELKFRAAGKATVVLIVNPENPAAVRLYELAGFVTRETDGAVWGFDAEIWTMTREID